MFHSEMWHFFEISPTSFQIQKQPVSAHSLDKPLETCQDQQNNRRDTIY